MQFVDWSQQFQMVCDNYLSFGLMHLISAAEQNYFTIGM